VGHAVQQTAWRAGESNSGDGVIDNGWLSVAMDIDTSLLRAFVATAEELHFSRAADRLHLSQQALSKRIARLEVTLGVAAVRANQSQGCVVTSRNAPVATCPRRTVPSGRGGRGGGRVARPVDRGRAQRASAAAANGSSSQPVVAQARAEGR
jgi:hypothetical protein